MFLLRKPASGDAVVELNGWTTTVVAGVRAVVSCGLSTATDHAGVFSDALQAANHGLDYMSATGKTHSLIDNAPGDCIVWWPNSTGGCVMRASIVFSIHGLEVNFSATVTDAAGIVRPPPPAPTPVARDVFRFMRMAKTSPDLFDAYRNLFLALEYLLDDIHPHQEGGEGQWFKAALAVADALIPVSRLAPADEADPIEWVYQNVYGDERSGLMHAKQRRGYLLPQDAASRAGLTTSMETLWRYVRDLVEAHLNVRSGETRWSAYGWAAQIDPVLQQLVVFVSDDETPLTDSPSPPPTLKETSTTIEQQPGAPAADPDDPMTRRISGSWAAQDLRGIQSIRRIGTKEPGVGSVATAWSELIGPLQLGDSVARFEVVSGIRCVSRNGPPALFSS
ncbi:hypothetical protein EV580_0105 [Mycobacterium sp. BK086]|nr:hypothetical protein EV580_0105 [Mycobacterium sp. BK086]